VGAWHHLQTCLQCLVATQPEGMQPFFGERQTCARFDFCFVIFDGFAHEVAKAFFGRHHPAALFEHVTQDGVGDGLAVDQHAIAIKKYGLKIHAPMLTASNDLKRLQRKATAPVRRQIGCAHASVALCPPRARGPQTRLRRLPVRFAHPSRQNL